MKTRISLADNSELKTDRYDSSQESDSNSKTAHTSRFAILNSHLYRVAAVLVLLLVGGTFWYREHTRVTPPTISEEVQTAMQLSRNVDEQFAEQLAEAKRITTYQDKEYWVTLEDGTLVHLNYNSRLIYPEKFGDRRDVILDGEAYFMVAKDKSRQFVVHTPQGDIRVYGTEFWVNTRADVQASQESTLSCQLALVRGSISFTPTEGKETMLKPGQELSIVDSQLSITDIDTWVEAVSVVECCVHVGHQSDADGEMLEHHIMFEEVADVGSVVAFRVETSVSSQHTHIFRFSERSSEAGGEDALVSHLRTDYRCSELPCCRGIETCSIDIREVEILPGLCASNQLVMVERTVEI